MKILQVSHGFPPRENAGVELYTFHLSKALAQLGHQVHVFCREEESSKEEFSLSEDEVEGLRVTRVVNNLTRITDPRIFYDNHFFDDAFRMVLKREKPEIVHFQHMIALSGNLIKIAKEQGDPVVLTLHDFFILCHRIQLLKGNGSLCGGPLYGLECVSCLKEFFHSSLPRDWRTNFFLKLRDDLPFPIIKWTKRLLIPPQYLGDPGYEAFHRYRYMYEMFKACDLLLTPSKFVKDFFTKYYPAFESKIKVLPLGIPPVRNRQRSKAIANKIRFCYLGNVLPFKGVHILLDAFKALPPGRASLTIWGDRKPWNGTYAYYDSLKEKTAGLPIEFRGAYPREDLPEVLSCQDVLVLPSLCPETFSLVIREAHLMGLPVIASRIGAIPEAIEEGVNGLLFEPGKVEELRNHMLRFIEEPELVRKLTSNLPKTKLMDEHAIELEQIYRGIIHFQTL
jgi:glycosyltransferase involved in cell wall biosynthesis